MKVRPDVPDNVGDCGQNRDYQRRECDPECSTRQLPVSLCFSAIGSTAFQFLCHLLGHAVGVREEEALIGAILLPHSPWIARSAPNASRAIEISLAGVLHDVLCGGTRQTADPELIAILVWGWPIEKCAVRTSAGDIAVQKCAIQTASFRLEPLPRVHVWHSISGVDPSERSNQRPGPPGRWR